MGLGFYQMKCRVCSEIWNDYWCSVDGMWHFSDNKCPKCGSADTFNTNVDPIAKAGVQGGVEQV